MMENNSPKKKPLSNLFVASSTAEGVLQTLGGRTDSVSDRLSYALGLA